MASGIKLPPGFQLENHATQNQANLPEGFTSEKPVNLPIGFTLESRAEAKSPAPAYGGIEGIKRAAFGGPIGYLSANGSEDSLPLVGQTAGSMIPGVNAFGGGVAGATIGEGLRQGIKSIRGTRTSQPRQLFGIGPKAPGIVNDLAGEAASTAAFGKAAELGGNLISKVPGRLMNSVLRPRLKDISKGANLGRDAADLGFFGTKKQIAQQADSLITQNESKLDSILKGSKGQVDVLDIASNLDDLAKGYANVGDDTSVKAIKEIQDSLLAKSPTGKISAQDAQQLKRDFYNVLKDSNYGTADVAAKTGARKQAARGLREGIEKAEPDQPIGELNRQMAVAGKTKMAIDKVAAQEEKNHIGGLKDTILALGGAAHGGLGEGAALVAASHILGSTPFLSGTAALLAKASKNKALANAIKFGGREITRRFGQ